MPVQSASSTALPAETRESRRLNEVSDNTGEWTVAHKLYSQSVQVNVLQQMKRSLLMEIYSHR